MDTYDVYLERYKSFNILSSIIAQAKSTEDLGQIYAMALKEAKQNGNFWYLHRNLIKSSGHIKKFTMRDLVIRLSCLTWMSVLF